MHLCAVKDTFARSRKKHQYVQQSFFLPKVNISETPVPDYEIPYLIETPAFAIQESKYMDAVHLRAKVDTLLAYAASFEGVRYRPAGKGPTSFDCSGFTSYVFKKIGISLASSSSEQGKQGVEIPISEIRPGDLVFFGGRRDARNSRIGHVGIIYRLDPDDPENFFFIHSAFNIGVSVLNYKTSKYYTARLRCFRNVIGDIN